MMDSNNWVSGTWRVKRGQGAEFVERWVEFLTWTKEESDGFVGARLLGDTSDPDHFVSFSAWRDAEALNTWRQQPEFAKRFGNCRALCDDMRAGDFELARSI